MKPLYTTTVATKFGQKAIEVFACDVRAFDEDVDVFVASAYKNSYKPTPGTVFDALNGIGISVQKLSKSPFIALSAPSRIWISEKIKNPERNGRIHRICCMDLTGAHGGSVDPEQALVTSIRAFFNMLDIASVYGVEMETVALPLLGSGNQNLSGKLTIVPLLNECISFLKRNGEVKRICFVEKNEIKADMIAQYIQKSYSVLKQEVVEQSPNPAKSEKRAFISYSFRDKNIADNLCFKLESNGLPVWYAPRDVSGAYAESIIRAIDSCTHFIVILSQNSMMSEHVLNEIDVAFQRLPNDIKFKPLRIDDSALSPSVKYYLSRQNWMNAFVPPLEARLNEFVKKVMEDL
ncbi:MAG: toll/interleukin-1 receptor domain-containing protein [Clostridia bacterium]|nr:toll/interleukin-1 receptor domain-containing protein [Clostridia bacterium]MBQ3505727.1 toll/interleukin-1 receptor domain-containing protein [Clostridia bacterium]